MSKSRSRIKRKKRLKEKGEEEGRIKQNKRPSMGNLNTKIFLSCSKLVPKPCPPPLAPRAKSIIWRRNWLREKATWPDIKWVMEQEISLSRAIIFLEDCNLDYIYNRRGETQENPRPKWTPVYLDWPKLPHVNPSEPKRTQVIPNEAKWTQVTSSEEYKKTRVK